MFFCSSALLLSQPSYAAEKPPQLNKGLLFLKKETILLSSSNWIVTIDVDLVSHAQAITNFMEAVDHFNPISLLSIHSNVSEPDQNIVQFLEKEARYMRKSAGHMLDDVTSINMTIDGITTRKREKRGLVDGAGEVMKFLFGTLTTRDFTKINDRINNVSMATNEMTHIVKDQLTIISKSYSHLNEQQIKFRKLETLTKFLEQDFFAYQKFQKTEIDKVNYRVTYLTKILQLSRSLSDSHDALYRTTQQIKSAFLYASQSTLDPYFLPYSQFMEITKDIQLRLPHGQEILSYTHDGNFQIIYSSLKMSVFSYKQMLRIFVEFPIYRHDKTFTIYEVLPLPTKIKNSDLFFSIVPSTDYFAISANLDYYYELSLADFNNCQKHSLTICSPTKAIKKANYKNCLFSLFTGKSVNIENICNIKTHRNFDPIFHRPFNSYNYIYSISGTIPIHTVCDNHHSNNNGHFPDFLTGNGILQIPHSCNVIGHDFILFGNNPIHVSTFSITNDIHIPKTFNFPNIHKIQTLNLSFSQEKYKDLNSLFHDDTNTNSTPVDLISLIQRLDNLQTGNAIFGYESDDYIQHFIFLCIIILLGCAAILYGLKRYNQTFYHLPNTRTYNSAHPLNLAAPAVPPPRATEPAPSAVELSSSHLANSATM